MSVSMIVVVTRTGDTWNARLPKRPQIFGSAATIDDAVFDLVEKLDLPKKVLLTISWKHSGGQPKEPEKAERGMLFSDSLGRDWCARVGGADGYGKSAFDAVESLIERMRNFRTSFSTADFVLEFSTQ